MDSDLDPGFRLLTYPNFPSSSSSIVNYTQKSRKKRSKLMKIDSDQDSVVVSKPKITKKPDPGAPKITRPCTECGKKFWSWKALFGHMRCHPERQWRGINPPPNHRSPIPPVQQRNDAESAMTEDDHEVAACLLMLANGDNLTECGTSSQLMVRENCDSGGNNCGFECSSCKRVFGSHQALGGHRASHKNVKGCFAINKSDETEFDQDQSRNDDKSLTDEFKDQNDKMLMVWGHKCSICFRVFPSGQALGGHKRCHWEKVDEPSLNQGLNRFGLDLNIPAPVEDGSSPYSSKLTLDLRLGL